MTSDELHMWRRQRQVTQGWLADRLGISRSTIARYEAGDIPIPKMLCAALRWISQNMDGNRA